MFWTYLTIKEDGCELNREIYLACNHSSRDVWNLSVQDSSVTNVDPLSLWLLKDERSFVRDEEENKTDGKKRETSQPYSSGPSDLHSDSISNSRSKNIELITGSSTTCRVIYLKY